MGTLYQDKPNLVLNLNGGAVSGHVSSVASAGGTGVLVFERCHGLRLFNGIVDARAPGTGEHNHAIRFHNCRDVIWEDIQIIAGTGDGVYITHDQAFLWGTGSEGMIGRRSHIWGDNTGRNGVSIICGKTILLEDLTIEKVTKPGWPGGIDLEPDKPAEYIDDVTIRRAKIHAGNGGALAGIMVYNGIAHAPITRIYTEDCEIYGPYEAGLRLGGSPHQNEGVTHVRPLVRNCKQNAVEHEGHMVISQPDFQGDDDCRKKCRKKDDAKARRRCLRRCN